MKPKYDEPLSKYAFDFHLRRYLEVHNCGGFLLYKLPGISTDDIVGAGAGELFVKVGQRKRERQRERE